jgi:murein DD-endopeptidase MepM/ murein hydrolase activator NlpD
MRLYNFPVSRFALALSGLVAAALLLPAAALAYPWPIRPFYQPHAIRGYFNDPRLSGPETGFHFGVDIVADDMTPVYAIEGGRVVARGMTVSVFPKRGGHLLSYWHVVPVVRTKQRVRTHQLIGHVASGAGHVHLAEYREGTYINPLRLGGLAPYIDDTVPRIPGLMFSVFGYPVLPDRLSGRIDITVVSYDIPPLPPPPEAWSQARLAPALIRWRVVQGQNTVRQWEAPVDFRTFLVPYSLFDFIYAPNTFQNRPSRPGNYVYYLAHEFDTATLPNGAYVLQVDALDAQENVAQASFAFIVAN